MIVAGDPNLPYFRSALNTGQISAPALSNLLCPKGNAASPYQAFNQNQDKEQFFEKIRSQHYSDLPSRLGAIFLFPDLKTATLANKLWWNETRSLHEARSKYCYSKFIADSEWLNCTKNDWESCAHSYFNCERTKTPLLEIIFVGIVSVNPKEIL